MKDLYQLAEDYSDRINKQVKECREITRQRAYLGNLPKGRDNSDYLEALKKEQQAANRLGGIIWSRENIEPS